MSLKLSGTQLGNITGGPSSLNLYELADVSISAPVSGQYLRYNSAISEWQNSVINTEVYNFLDVKLSGSNGVVLTKASGPQTVDIGLNITTSGDATGSLTAGDLALTLATVNANVGTFGSATQIPVITANGKGLITSISQTAFTGTAPLATSLAAGAPGELPFQSATGVTSFVPAGTTSQVLVGSPTAPSWSNTPTLTGTNFTGIPNGALTNSALTIGSTGISLGGTTSTLTGLTSVTSTNFVGTATNASALAVPRSISITSDATWTVNFDGSANVSSALTFATVNASPQADTFRKITVNGKGLTTATSAVAAGDITASLGYTPVNRAGDTMTGQLILSGAPGSALAAATKQYVDTLAAGLNVHGSCVTATTATLASSSGGTVTYNNGAAGVGATLTTTGSFANIGGAVAIPNTSRILVKNEATAANNGIYVKDSDTVLTRADDFDGSPAAEITAGDFTYVSGGTVGGTNWAQTTTGTITVGTTAINFTQLSGPGTYVGGSGINVTSNTISNTGVLSNIGGTGITVSSATGNVTITNDGVTSLAGTSNQIAVSAATGAVTLSLPSSVTIAGTLTAGTFSGAGTNITGTASSLSIGGNAATATVAAGISGASYLQSIGSSTSWGLTSGVNTGAFNGVMGTSSSATWLLSGSSSGVFRSGIQTLDAGGTTRYYTGTDYFQFSGTTLAAGTFSGSGSGLTGTASSLSIGGNSATVGGFTPSASAGVGSRVVVADASGYINNTFFYSTDNSVTNDVKGIMVKTNAGSEYLRTGTAAAVHQFLASTTNTQSQVYTGVNNFTSSANSVGFNSQLAGLAAYGDGTNSAGMSFHRPGAYAINMGLDSDNAFRIGGWSDGTSVYRAQFYQGGSLRIAGALYPNNGSNYLNGVTGSYGALDAGGSNNGYSGIHLVNGGDVVTGMYDASGNGGDWSSASSWHFYWNRGVGCLGIGGSSTVSGYKMNVNGSGRFEGAMVATGESYSTSARINSASPTLCMQDTDNLSAFLHVNSNLIYFLRGSAVNSTTWDSGPNGRHPMIMDMTNGNVSFSGDVIAYSDRRLKRDIAPISDALSKVCLLQGVSYRRMDTEETHIGVIAQDVQPVVPEVVTEDADGYLAVAYGKMVALLIESVKELNAKVDALKAEIVSLKK